MRERLRKIWQKRRYRYTLYIGIIVGVFFLTSSIIAITLFGVLPERAIYLLPDTYKPTKTDRVLVIAPHPDDETIAVGGYDYEAVKAGAEVKIDLVTDGNKHGLRDTRYKEFKNAAKAIGIPEENLEFWGFRDGQKNENNLPAIKNRIIAEIKQYRPTVIIAPVTQDAHYDHYLSGKAYLEAVEATGYSGHSYGYLVHHRYYPQPKKFAPNRYLSPPIKYLNYSQGWTKTILNEEAEDTKNEAVLGYRSQLRVPLLNTLLKSMIRKNEIFLKLQ